jgi:hypothetical protein
VILNLRLDDGLRLDLFWRIEDGRALAVFAWRCGIDAIGRGSVGRFVFGWFAKNLWQRLVHGDRIGRVGEGNLRLLFDNISDTESIGIMNDFGVRQRDRGAVIAVVSGGFLTVLGAGLVTTFLATTARESFTGQNSSAIPAFRDAEPGSGRDDYVGLDRFGHCCDRLVSALTVLGERFAGENDGLGCGGIEFRGLTVSG